LPGETLGGRIRQASPALSRNTSGAQRFQLRGQQRKEEVVAFECQYFVSHKSLAEILPVENLRKGFAIFSAKI